MKYATEAVLLSRSEFKSQEYEQNSERKSSWIRSSIVLLETRKKSMISSYKNV